MSIKVMSMVFDRYPNGGGEMLLALSLADFAEDDGTRVFPSIKQLAEKTRQSERTVQYQLRKMEQSGWLILVNSGNGGRNQRREYVINPDWIKGADFAPVQSTTEKGATDGIKGCKPQQERVQPIAPAYTRHRPIKDPSINHQGASAPVDDDFEHAWKLYPKRSGGNSKAAARKAWQARLKAGVSADDMIDGVERYAAYCNATGRTGTQYVRQAATFFGPDLHFEERFDIPAQTGKPQTNAERIADWDARMNEVLERSLQPARQPMKDMGKVDAII